MKNLFNVPGLILAIILTFSCEEKSVPPSLSTTIVTAITTTTAVSGGNITADGGAPIIARGVCWNTSDNPTVDNSKTIENGDLASFNSNITQLTPNTSYYVRAYATNSAGTGYGESVSFKTLGDKPSSNGQNATNVTINSATLTGSVNPNFLSTTVTFEYGVTTSYGSTATALESPLSGDKGENVTVKADLSELTPGTTYHFRIKAENSLGTTYSSDLTFTTLGQVPTVNVQAASNLQVRTATINGSINPNYLPTTVTFEWGTTTGYGNTVTATQSPVTGSTSVSVSDDLIGLTPGTTYHFRIVATNELGTTNSSDLTFTTPGQIPTVTTPATLNLKVNTVTLNGSVNPNYLSTIVTFEWGTTTDYGNTRTASQSHLNGSTPFSITADLSGLTPETTYHFRITATNELGTTNSNDLEFTTYAVEDADKNLYHSVTIGTQTWMKENLKTTHFNDNMDIPKVTDNTEWSNLSTPAYCWYNNDETTNKDIYGALYNWYAVNTGNLCPTGWHEPSLDEWHTLVTYLGGDSIADENLRESGNKHWIFDTGANNNTGFTLLPAGNRESDGRFYNLGLSSHIWSSFEDYENTIQRCWNIGLEWHISKIYWTPYTAKFGASVRCLKD